MKSHRNKIILLVLLCIVMAYVWGKNLHLFSDSGPVSSRPSTQVQTVQSPAGSAPSYSYRPPRVNPFRIPDASPDVPAKQQQNRPKPPVQPSPGRPSGLFDLIGAIDRPPHSQIVLRDRNGRSFVKGEGDSLTTWTLIHISTEMAVFVSGTDCDTLFLEK